MPNTRMLLWIALGTILFYCYQVWMHDYPPSLNSVATSTTGAPVSTLGDSVPQAASAVTPAAPAVAVPPAAEPPPLGGAAPGVVPAAAPDAGPMQPVHVTTDVLDVVINLKGGELDQADLLKYPLRKDAPNIPVRLLSHEPPASLYLLQTGLIGGAGEAAPTHLAAWSSAEKSFALAASSRKSVSSWGSVISE